jgi:hypothetical protein
MDSVLSELGVKPDFEYPAAAGAKFDFIHRRDGNTDIYFISNQRKQSEAVEGTFRVAGKTPELWDARTGSIMPAPLWHEQDGRTVVSLSLDPAGSVFVVFRDKPQSDHLVAVNADLPPQARTTSTPPDLRIIKAVYGLFEAGHVDVTAKVKSLLASGANQIQVGNDLAGDDPAPSAFKRLRIEFRADGRKHSVLVAEGESLKLPPDSEVIKATYGDLPARGGSSWIDVTKKINSLLREGAFEIRVDKNLAGRDPAPHLAKKLVVEYRLDRRQFKLEVLDGHSFVPPDGAQIVKALYGSSQVAKGNRHLTVDITARLAARVQNGRLSVMVDNTLAGRDPAYFASKELSVDYSLNGELKHVLVSERDTLTLPDDGPPANMARGYDFTSAPDGATRLRCWAPGKFNFTWASGRKTSLDCASTPAPVGISGPWQLAFPPGWNAPASITLDHLQSWTANADPGVKYFSGTAAYSRDIEIAPGLLASDREVWLDLGAVKNLAEVSVNGQCLGVLWKPPFSVNITAAAKPGANHVEIKVVNLWPNRLIGDDLLAPDCQWNGKELKAWPKWFLEGKPSPTGHVTFTTWRHWRKSDNLLDSGLLGPVTLRAAQTFDLH